MSRTRTVVQGAAYSGASVFLSMAALLIVGKVFTNTLLVQEVAVFGAIMATADFLNILLGLGIYNGLPKLIAAAPQEHRSDYARAALLGQGIVSIAFAALFYAVYTQITVDQLPQNAFLELVWPSLWLVPPLVVVGTLRETGMAALAGLNRYAARAAAISIAALGQVVLVVIALLALDMGLPGLVLATLAAHAFSVLTMIFGLSLGRGGLSTRTAWWASFRFSFPLYLNGLLTFFYTRFDFFIVAFFLGSVAAGIYDTIKRLPTILARILNAMLVPYLPNLSALIAQGDRDGAARMMHHALGLSAFLGYGAVFSAVCVQELVIRMLFSAEYLPGAPVLGLLLAAIALTVQAGIIGQSLIALGHPKAITLINIGLAIAGVVGNVLLLPHFGLLGAGYAALLAIAFSYLLQALAAQHYGMAIRWRALIAPQIALAVSAALLVLGGSTLPFRLLALGLFVTLCLAFGVVTPQHLRAVISALRPVPKNGAPS